MQHEAVAVGVGVASSNTIYYYYLYFYQMTPFSYPLFIVISDRTQNIYIAASYHDLSNNSVAYMRQLAVIKCVFYF